MHSRRTVILINPSPATGVNLLELVKGTNEVSVDLTGQKSLPRASMRSLCGIIGPSDLNRDTEIAEMTRALVYGGAKSASAVFEPSAGLALGGSVDEANSVMGWNDTRTIGFALTGEIFSLQHDNAAATDRPSFDRLLEAYAQEGVRALARFNGWFSLVIVDRRTSRVIVSNDRYGLGRIYWRDTGTGFYFASEAKALLAVLPDTRRLDPRGVAEFLSNGCVLQNRSLYAGIQLLPGGSCWTFEQGRLLEKGRYFDPATWEQRERIAASDYVDELSRVFSRVVRRYVHDDRGVAMSLTGGLDSRMVLAWGGMRAGTMPCYTFGGPIRDCADVTIARDLARVSGQSHQTLYVEDAFFRDFASLAARNVHATDGNMDVSGAIELYMNQRAREIAPIRLTGNYGSEILRANVAFRPGRLDRSLFTPEFNSLIDEARETYEREATASRISFIAFKQVSWHHYSRFAAERSQLTPRSPFLDNELVELAFRIPRELEGNPFPLLELITRGNPALDRVRTDRALRSKSNAFGKLQRGWQEFTAKAEYAYDYGMPPWLVRTDSILRPFHLERLFLGRHKFYHFRVWYRDQLKPALLGGEFDRPLPFYRDGIPARLIQEHTSGRSNRTTELHKLLTLQLADRQLASSPCLT
jgi:asparagine synthase (glutamine-hydrolysing)